MRQAGRYLPEYRAIRAQFPNFMSFCFASDAATEVTLQPVNRFNLDAAIIFADILTIPQALGHNVTFTEGEGPRVTPFTHATQLTGLTEKLENIPTTLAPIYQTVRQTRAALPAHKAVIGFSGGPFTLACYMVDEKPSQGIPNLLTLAATEPTTFQGLIDTLTQACITYLSHQIMAGADAIQLFESWALACPPHLWHQAVHTPLLAIGKALHTLHPNTPVILFPRGATPAQLEGLTQNARGAFKGLSLATETNLTWATQTLQPTVTLQGNLNPTFMEGDIPSMLAAAKMVLETAAATPEQKSRFIFNLGHGLTPQSKPDNVQALAEFVHNWV